MSRKPRVVVEMLEIKSLGLRPREFNSYASQLLPVVYETLETRYECIISILTRQIKQKTCNCIGLVYELCKPKYFALLLHLPPLLNHGQ